MWLARPLLNQNLPLKTPGHSSARYGLRLLPLHHPIFFQNPPTLQNLLPTPTPVGSPLGLLRPNGNFPSSEPLEPFASFQSPELVVHSWLEPFPSSCGQKSLRGMTCNLVSFLPSAPPGPGTQQVLRNCSGSCSCKKPTSLSKPGQEEQSWLRAIYFIIPSTRLAPPV